MKLCSICIKFSRGIRFWQRQSSRNLILTVFWAKTWSPLGATAGPPHSGPQLDPPHSWSHLGPPIPLDPCIPGRNLTPTFWTTTWSPYSGRQLDIHIPKYNLTPAWPDHGLFFLLVFRLSLAFSWARFLCFCLVLELFPSLQLGPVRLLLLFCLQGCPKPSAGPDVFIAPSIVHDDLSLFMFVVLLCSCCCLLFVEFFLLLLVFRAVPSLRGVFRYPP